MKKIPFKAALFDLDGTLLDSMYVWHRVDDEFFAARGMSVPEGYGRALAGMSYRESAQYTVRHYLPNERWEDLIEEWMHLTEIEYAQRVPAKPGAVKYLRMLRRSGVKLAVTTALPPRLYRPCLERLGILNLFDELCSTEDTGGRGKADGEVYELAARRLGVNAEDCAVFEDVLVGIQGAKKVGMRAYALRDDHAKKDFAAMEACADGCMDSLEEMCAVHDFPESPRCVIYTARCEGDLSEAYQPQRGDFVLCADGGWQLAKKAGVKPDLVIGDFDSSDMPEGENVERHPVMKDDTDTMLCLKNGIQRGYERFLIVGGFGGRLDHTLANLQTLCYAAKLGLEAEMCDGLCRAQAVYNGKAVLPRRKGKLSLFAVSDRCRGITTTGTVYALKDGELDNAFPLGVSNEYAADVATVTVRDGLLLIVQTDD